jgi:hypothetical protein
VEAARVGVVGAAGTRFENGGCAKHGARRGQKQQAHFAAAPRVGCGQDFETKFEKRVLFWKKSIKSHLKRPNAMN